MKKKPLSIVIVLIAMVLMYFGFNIDLGAFGINETLQSNTSNDTTDFNEISEINDSIDDSKEIKQYSFRTNELMDIHYKKHKDEFGVITKDEYLDGANNLINQLSDTVMTKTEDDGDTLYYDTKTHEFVVLSEDGYIRTYFIPEDGIDYFNRK
jgi:pyocin large subunit-like protein